MRATTSQYEISDKITFDQSKRFPPVHNLPVREKEKIIGTRSILA